MFASRFTMFGSRCNGMVSALTDRSQALLNLNAS